MAKACKCGSARVLHVCGKTSDMCAVEAPWLGVEYDGYVPKLPGIDTGNDGFGDYIQYSFCADCGQIQNFRKVSDAAVRKALRS
jgi:hypothetical protein